MDYCVQFLPGCFSLLVFNMFVGLFPYVSSSLYACLLGEVGLGNRS